MDSRELYRESQMKYSELVEHLLGKYGAAQYDYFLTESCKTKNPKVTRSKEGLICHHIDEDKAIMLSNDKYAVMNPFAYQKANRLVYCNFLEHLLLHIKIVDEPRNAAANENELPGIGGVINYLCRQLNDYYSGYEIKQAWIITAFDLIKDNYEEYIEILGQFWGRVRYDPIYIGLIELEDLCRGWTGEIVKMVYRDLQFYISHNLT